MKYTFFPIFVLIFAFLLVGGCSKDEKVAELEEQIKESESQDLLEDTVTDEATAELTDTTVDDYAMTPETAPEEEPAPTYMPKHTDGVFTLQIAAGSNPEWVKHAADTYIRRGYDAFITETIVDDQTFYRLRIGSFESVAAAKDIGLELKDKYSVDFWIDNNN